MTRTNQGGKYLERVRTRLLTSKHLIYNETQNTHIQLQNDVLENSDIHPFRFNNSPNRYVERMNEMENKVHVGVLYFIYDEQRPFLRTKFKNRNVHLSYTLLLYFLSHSIQQDWKLTDNKGNIAQKLIPPPQIHSHFLNQNFLSITFSIYFDFRQVRQNSDMSLLV